MSHARPLLKLVTFEHQGTRKIGNLFKNEIVDLTKSLGVKDMKSFLEGGDALLHKANDASKATNAPKIPLADAKIKAPIYNPDKIICVGLNYLDHAKETNMAIPSEPILFNKFSPCIIGHLDKIVKPKETNELDYEVELVIVIGKEGRRIKESEAANYIAGYTVGHDVSARDWQLRKPGGQWMAGKAWDTFAPIGPSIVTSVSNPNNLGIRCFLNHDIVQQSNTDQLIFKTEKLVSYISQLTTLKPGDLIFTGTPPGVGMGRKPPLWLKPGDKVVCEIEELGSLENDIIEETSKSKL